MDDKIKNRSVIQIQTDRKLDKKHEEHVCKGGRRLVSFSLRGDDVIISGDDSSVNIAVNEDISIKDLKNKLKALGEPQEKGHNLKYILKEPSRLLPPMRVKIGGKKWSNKAARIQVTEYMTELGYGRGGRYSYREDKPSWWPQSITWERCEHPYDLTMDECKQILETIIKVVVREEPDTYHYGKEEDNEKEETKKRRRNSSKRSDKGEKEKNCRKSKKSKALIDNSDSEEEIEDGEVLDEENEEDKEEQVSDDSLGEDVNDSLDLFVAAPPVKKRKVSAKSLLKKKAEMPQVSESAYEKVQAQNIKERKDKLKQIMNDSTI